MRGKAGCWTALLLGLVSLLIWLILNIKIVTISD